MWPDAASVEKVGAAGFQLQMEQWKAYTRWYAKRIRRVGCYLEGAKVEVTGKDDLVFFPIYQLL